MKENIFQGDKIDVDEKAKMATEESIARQRKINFGMVFSTREGFEVLKDIMTFCHADEISYIQGDTHESAFREGERNVFLYIKAQLSDEMKQKIMIGG